MGSCGRVAVNLYIPREQFFSAYLLHFQQLFEQNNRISVESDLL